jgi:predicted DNA-binding antitoxin AbrB/MazE fold protein
MDSQVTEAVYSGGVLRPLGEISLRESERVRLIIERHSATASGRQVALERLRAGIAQMNFALSGRPPSRDDLHDRI